MFLVEPGWWKRVEAVLGRRGSVCLGGGVGGRLNNIVGKNYLRLSINNRNLKSYKGKFRRHF